MALTKLDASQTAALNDTFIGVGRNRIINGDMIIDQRQSGALVTINTGAGAYGCDRWTGFGTASAGVFKTQRVTTTPPTGFTNYTHVTVTTQDATPAASALYGIYQNIEGYNMRDFSLGSASAVTFTLSFWVQSNLTGQFGGSVKNFNASRDYAFTYSINVANTWERKTVTVVGDVTGTWHIDNTGGMLVIFDLGCGSTTLTTAGSWGSTNVNGATGDTKIISSTSNTWDLTGVQVEIGTSASNFEYVPWPVQFMQCQRYYQNWSSAETAPQILAVGQCTATTQIQCVWTFTVPMRTIPTLTVIGATNFEVTNSGASFITCTTVSADSAASIAYRILANVASGLVAGNASTLWATNSSGNLTASAEL